MSPETVTIDANLYTYIMIAFGATFNFAMLAIGLYFNQVIKSINRDIEHVKTDLSRVEVSGAETSKALINHMLEGH